MADQPSVPGSLQTTQAALQQKTVDQGELRQAFDQFVGETFYSHMLKALRSSLDKPAYFHGGRGEEVFQGQLDQVFAEKLTQSTASKFTGPMFELFQLSRR
jgi:hypothetical protein